MADTRELQARLQELNDTAQALIDRWEIEELKARYFRTVDAKDWEGFRATFTDDLQYDYGDGNWHHGADAFVASVKESCEGAAGRAVTFHRGHMPEIVVDSPTEAHGHWGLADYLEWPMTPDGRRAAVKGYGREYEDYRKEDGVWKIATWRLMYIRFDPVRPEPLPEKMLGGTADLEDESYIDAVTQQA